MNESVVFCEGYHDRAFWTGWLEHLGCINLGRPQGSRRRISVPDPWGDKVTGGEFAFHSAQGAFVRISPCNGKDNVLPAAESRLKDREVRELIRLVLAVDSDLPVDAAGAAHRTLSLPAVEAMLNKVAAPTHAGRGEYLVDDGRTIVSVVRWETGDGALAGVPRKQTLERLACAALVAAYPDRGPAIERWLGARPDAPDAGPKEFAWSHMAGWYAEYACEAFFRCLWDEPAVATELEARLRACGAWQVAEALSE